MKSPAWKIFFPPMLVRSVLFFPKKHADFSVASTSFVRGRGTVFLFFSLSLFHPSFLFIINALLAFLSFFSSSIVVIKEERERFSSDIVKIRDKMYVCVCLFVCICLRVNEFFPLSWNTDA